MSALASAALQHAAWQSKGCTCLPLAGPSLRQPESLHTPPHTPGCEWPLVALIQTPPPPAPCLIRHQQRMRLCNKSLAQVAAKLLSACQPPRAQQLSPAAASRLLQTWGRFTACRGDQARAHTQPRALLDMKLQPAPQELHAALLAAQRPHALLVLHGAHGVRPPPVQVQLACPAA